MVKSFIKKASLVCLLSLLFVTKGTAGIEWQEWYCDPNNGTYSIIDQTESGIYSLPADLYFVTMPQNIAAGETMYAHFKTRCVGNATYNYEATVTAKDVNRNALSGNTIRHRSTNWSNDYTFQVYPNTQYFEYFLNNNKNTKLKYVKLWVPMPVHLDAEDQCMEDSVEMGKSKDMYVALKNFFTDANNHNINVEIIDDELNAGDFSIVRGTLSPAQRCGSNHTFCLSQRQYFFDLKDCNNKFIIRFTPSAPGVRQAKLRISNGPQEKIITICAKGYNRNVKFWGVGGGRVALFVNHNDNDTMWNSPYVFQQGDDLRFVAIPDEGYHFVNWNCNIFQNYPEVNFIGTNSCHVYANFAPNYYRVCAMSADPCHGRVNYGTCPMHHYFHGNKVLFTACPAPGYVFKGWSTCSDPDVIISTDPNYMVTLTGDICLLGHFDVEGEDDGFRFICETDNGVDIKYENGDPNIPEAAFLYSYDKISWNTYVNGETIHLDNKGDVVYFKADSVNSKGVRGYFEDDNEDDESIVPAFICSDSVSVAGNAMYLLNNAGETTELPAYAFEALLATNKVIYADELILPADSVSNFAYRTMFRGCYTLRTAPVLPATKIEYGSYQYMFMNDSMLAVAPELPITYIKRDGCKCMFQGCVSLTAAPVMNVTSIGVFGCSHMYDGCINLVDVQDTLPAMNLEPSAYEFMFSYCSSLVSAPALPATTLASLCYKKMFRGCTSLVNAPVLPATTLVDRCYWGMFDGCSSLARIEVAFSEFVNKGFDTQDWTRGVADDGVFICPNMPGSNQKRNNPSMNSYKYIPMNWNVNPQQQDAPRFTENEVDYIAVAEDMNIIVKGAQDATVAVYDAAGRLVSSVENATDFESIQVSVPGVYVVTVSGQESTRLIVK